MNATAALLDRARETCSLPSDNAFSARMGLPRQVVSAWRIGKQPIPDERIAQICAMAHLDAGEWLARIHAERATDATERRAWLGLLDRLGAMPIMSTLARWKGRLHKTATVELGKSDLRH